VNVKAGTGRQTRLSCRD